MEIDASPPNQAKIWSWVSCLILSILLVSPKTALSLDSLGPYVGPSPLILAQAQPPPSEDPPKPEDTPTDQPSGDPPAEDGGEEEEEEEGPARIPLAGVQQGGVLLQRDQLVLEPTLGYSYSTNSRLILSGFSVLPLIILGTLQSERVTTQTFAPSLGFRYGIKRGIQMDVRIPFLVQSISRLRVNQEAAGQSEISGDDAGIGDVTFGFSYQFLYERAWIPDMVIRIGGSAPTGRSQFDIFEDIASTGGGFENIDVFEEQLTQQGSALGSGRWTIDGTITGVKALDPAILFGTVGYSYSPSINETLLQVTGEASEGGVQVQVDKVDANLGAISSITASLGMAISLNNQLSMNWSFSNLYRFAQEANGQKIPDSQLQVANFNMGFNIAVTPRITTNIVGSIGITPDAPDFSAAMTIPISFTNALGSTVTWLKEHRPFKSKAPPPLPEADEAPAQKEPTKGESPSNEPIPTNGKSTTNGNGGPPSMKEPQK